jgi:nitrogen fixation protein NifU and related proteins
MISNKIIKIASDDKFYGLIKDFDYSSTCKNKLCGDIIKIQIKTIDNKIKTIRYETDACVFCEASASLISNNFRNFLINDFKKDIESLKKLIKRDHISLPNKFKKFNQLIKNENKSRFDCIMLPFNAILKAINL